MLASVLLIILFALTIGHLLSLKLCSNTLDHRTAPIFISLWTLIGLAIVWPVFGHLWAEGIAKFQSHPYLLILAILKGGMTYWLLTISQELTAESLSSRHYVTPMAIGIMVFVHAGLGEHLSIYQWFSAISLCLLAVAFFFKGHLADLSMKGRKSYLKLIVLAVILSAFDLLLAKNANWFSLLLVSNVTLFLLSFILHGRNVNLIKSAVFNRYAIVAGMFYAATELVKFYQIVTINPVTVVATVQAATKPVILILSAYLWHERTVKEQLIWGGLAFMITLPLFFKL